MTHIITIDGPAASGKGTLARRLAGHLDYFYLDTGAIYRFVGITVRDKGIEPETEAEKAVVVAKELAVAFQPEQLLNPILKSDIAGQMASRCAAIAEVRQAVLGIQRTLAKTPPENKNGSVLDGRDCGTVICPDADRKIYIVADVEVRAKRRLEELIAQGSDVSYETVLADMKERDDRDMNRTVAPLKPAEDAVILDTSAMGIDEAFEAALSFVS